MCNLCTSLGSDRVDLIDVIRELDKAAKEESIISQIAELAKADPAEVVSFYQSGMHRAGWDLCIGMNANTGMVALGFSQRDVNDGPVIPIAEIDAVQLRNDLELLIQKMNGNG
jgi:hypothetical protein